MEKQQPRAGLRCEERAGAPTEEHQPRSLSRTRETKETDARWRQRRQEAKAQKVIGLTLLS